ncbi:tyrosine-type recombinase/integrase [Streptomyces europaeiscabiei]|uniref:tyrosine-type recombinase/integrase n=1 Tax=Streptomyces europaeiscabiei TaxID=146819 RepID=UPI002E198633
MRLLRPSEAVFEKMIEGFVECQQARALQPDTIASRVRTVRQLHAFSDGFPWEWNALVLDQWSAAVAAAVAHSTLGQKQLQLRAFLSYLVNPAYGWASVCREMFGTFPTMVLAELNSVRHSQGYVGRPSRNRPLTRPEVRAFFGQMDPEIARLRAAGHKGALTAARDLAMFTTMYGWGLRRREAARLEIHDWRRQARLAEFGDFAGLAVRWGKALPGQPPRRRMVISVWPWAVATVRYYVQQIRPLFYRDGLDDGVMFPTERGGEISVRSVNDRFAHWRLLTGLPGYLCPHCLRHTYVTRLIEAGYDASFVTEQVGHSHAATTAIYTALSSDYKNSKVREFLDAAEEEALRSAFARAEAEADMDDEFDTADGESASVTAGSRGTR